MAEAVGVRLKALREYFGWSQRELAKRAGVPNSAISVIEQGSVSPSVLSLQKVLKGFSLTLDQFFSIDAGAPVPAPVAATEDDDGKVSCFSHSVGQSNVGVTLYRGALNQVALSRIPSSRGLLVLSSGSADFFSVGAQFSLVAGQSIGLRACVPYRVEPFSTDCSWLVVDLPH